MTHRNEQDPNAKKAEAGETPPPGEQRRETRKEIPVVSIPNEQDMIAEEMAALFEEDQVTHQHGSAEPEGD